MLVEKSSFLVYTDYLEQVKLLSMERRGMLFTAMLEYAATGEVIEMDEVTNMAFSFIRTQIDRDTAAYLEKVEAKKNAGRIGGLTKKANASSAKANVAKGSSAKNVVANLHDNEYVNDNVNDKTNNGFIDNNVSLPQVESRPSYPYEDIIEYLNQKAGTNYRYSSTDTKKHIKARFAEGYSFDDFKKVIDKKVVEWRGTDMEKYLRPATLFGSKFEAYLNQKETAKAISAKKNSFNNFTQRTYDYDELERLLLATNV